MDHNDREVLADYLGAILGVAILVAFYYCT